MHLLDWNSYKVPDAPTPPPFLGEPVYSVKTDKANNAFTGLRVRSTPGGSVAALLPKGSKVRTGNAHAASPRWVELLEVIEGQASPALAGVPLGWVFTGEMEATGEANTYLIGEKANDHEPNLIRTMGLNVRKAPNGQSAEMGQLPLGAKIRIEAGTGAFRKLLEVVAGQNVTPHAGNSINNLKGYVHFDSLQSEQTQPELNSVQVLPTSRPIKAGELIGHMGQYQNRNDSQPRPLLHLEVFSCEDVPAFIEKSRAVAENLPADQKTLIKVHADSSIKQPSAADTQVPAGSDVRISTDSPKEGHWAKVQQYAVVKANKSELGGYESATKTYPLSPAQKSALATKVGADASTLPNTADFLLEYYDASGGDARPYSGGSIPATHPQRKIGVRLTETYWVELSQLNAQGQRNSTESTLQAWTNFPLSNANPGQPSGYERILSGGSWADLPAEHKAIAQDNTRWWYVTVGGKEGQDVSGWVPEIDPIISKHSPWEWPGFTTIEDKTPLEAQCSRNLDATQCITGDEQQTYAAMIEQAERGPIFSKLYDIIDAQNQEGERDGKLTPEEFRTALEKPWLAQSISQIITHHESEWLWKAAKWNAIDPLMVEEPGQVNQDWEVEKRRIEKLSWWGGLSGEHAINSDGKVWHINSISLTSKLAKKNFLIDTKRFITEYSAQHMNFNSDSIRLNEQSKKNLEQVIEQINTYYEDKAMANTYELAYMFATARHEAYDFISGNYFSSEPEIGEISYFNKYDPVLADNEKHRQRAKDNENTVEGDGYKYRGRGLVHLTWKINYRMAKEHFGIDFVTTPDSAAEYKNSVPIMIWGVKEGVFTGKALSQYINRTTKNYERARQVINGTDKSQLIASYAEKFEAILKKTFSASEEFGE